MGKGHTRADGGLMEMKMIKNEDDQNIDQFDDP